MAPCCVVAVIAPLDPISHIILNLSRSHFAASAACTCQDLGSFLVLDRHPHSGGRNATTSEAERFEDMFTFEFTPGSQIVNANDSLAAAVSHGLIQLYCCVSPHCRRAGGGGVQDMNCARLPCTDAISEQRVHERKKQNKKKNQVVCFSRL